MYSALNTSNRPEHIHLCGQPSFTCSYFLITIFLTLYNVKKGGSYYPFLLTPLLLFSASTEQLILQMLNVQGGEEKHSILLPFQMMLLFLCQSYVDSECYIYFLGFFFKMARTFQVKPYKVNFQRHLNPVTRTHKCSNSPPIFRNICTTHTKSHEHLSGNMNRTNPVAGINIFTYYPEQTWLTML